jgi:hypothetical protein
MMLEVRIGPMLMGEPISAHPHVEDAMGEMRAANKKGTKP